MRKIITILLFLIVPLFYAFVFWEWATEDVCIEIALPECPDCTKKQRPMYTYSEPDDRLWWVEGYKCAEPCID